MREIKFKAWDNLRKIIVDKGEPFEMSDLLSAWFDENKSDEFKNWVILQYIGLKDKNGKEIYEGHIVRARWIEDDMIYRGKVIFQDGCFRLFINKWFIPIFNSEYSSYIRELEIIGNIYENPELLETIK